jgi:hypothetical protein
MTFLPMRSARPEPVDRTSTAEDRVRKVMGWLGVYIACIVRSSFLVETMLILFMLSILLSGLPGPVG